MEHKPPPATVRTVPPPPVTGLAHELSGPGGPIGATSIYEARGISRTADQDPPPVVILDRGFTPVADLHSSRRVVPFAVTRGRPAPTIVPADPTAVDADGPWTVGEQPPPDAPVIRRVVRDAPPAPKARRKAIVKFTSYGAADKEEQGWVIGGETGMRLVTTDQTTGRRRLVAVYLAFQVESYVVDDSRPDEVTIFGKIRWHGMPADRDEAWQYKFLRRDGGMRLEELRAALELFFAFADPRIGMVPRFLGVPATTAESAVLYGCQCFPGDGNPSVKFMTDMSHTQAGARAAIAFYRQAQGLFAFPLQRMWWNWFNPAREALYTLGERFEIEGLPPAQVKDGLTPFERACLVKDVAVKAAGPVASCGKVAWNGDPQIEFALSELGMSPVAGTTYTVYQDGEGE